MTRLQKRMRKRTQRRRQNRRKKKKLLAERASRRMLGLRDINEPEWNTYYGPSTSGVSINPSPKGFKP